MPNANTRRRSLSRSPPLTRSHAIDVRARFVHNALIDQPHSLPTQIEHDLDKPP
jgi:hypothetical protein